MNLHIAISNRGDISLALDPVLEKKIQVLIDLRKYKLLEKEEGKEGTYFVVETPQEKKLLIWAIPSTEAIGVRYINQMPKTLKAKETEGGIIIANGRYTQSAKTTARKYDTELIPPEFPSFDIFEHHLVPKHEILSLEEKDKVLEQFRVEAYQLPRIRTTDPIVRVVGAKPGDLIKITRKSQTAGEYVSYRYVVEG